MFRIAITSQSEEKYIDKASKSVIIASCLHLSRSSIKTIRRSFLLVWSLHTFETSSLIRCFKSRCLRHKLSYLYNDSFPKIFSKYLKLLHINAIIPPEPRNKLVNLIKLSINEFEKILFSRNE